jgi:hypothetical protein
MKKLIMTYSLTSSFLECEQRWAYAYIKGLEKRQWKEYYLVGTIFQYGIYLLMRKKDLIYAQKEMEIYLTKYIKDLRKKFTISTDDEKTFVELKAILKGMLHGYFKRYERDLEVEKHIANEQEDVYKINDNQFRIKMDNIVSFKNNWYLHEGKAWGYLSNEKVNNAVKSLQVATYFYLHNDNIDKTGYKKFKGIIFDAVQKPTIKQKIGESYRGYLLRLESYYTNQDSGKKFYKEVFDKPAISYDDWRHTIASAGIRMLKIIKEKKAPIKTFVGCNMCDFNELCYEGETRNNLALYKQNEYMINLRKEKK